MKSFIQCTFACWLMASMPGLAIGQDKDAAAGTGENIRQSVLELDRLHIDAKRQLALLQTLGEVTASIEVIRPYGESVLALLDDRKPMAERWRAVLAADLNFSGPQTSAMALQIETLLTDVAALRAAMAVLQSAPHIPFAEPPPTVPEIAEPELVLQEQLENWQLDAHAVRYAQVGAGGVAPAVWLDAPSGGRRLEVGSSTVVGERAIRLDKMDRRRDGRIRLLFDLDGQPVNIDW